MLEGCDRGAVAVARGTSLSAHCEGNVMHLSVPMMVIANFCVDGSSSLTRSPWLTSSRWCVALTAE